MNNPTVPKTPAIIRPTCAVPPALSKDVESPGLFVRSDQERAAPVKIQPLAIPRPRGRPPRHAPGPNRDDSPEVEFVRVGIRKRGANEMAGGPEEGRKAKQPKSRPNLALPDAEMVSIFAGPEDSQFRIHRHVITHYSTFYEDHFNNHKSGNGEAKVLRLPTVDAKVFGLFSHWSYFQVIEHAANHQNQQAEKPQLMELAKLWTTAGEWNVPRLQNEVIKMLLHMLISPNLPTGRGAQIWDFFKYAYSAQERGPLKLLSVEKLVRIIPGLNPLRQWVNEVGKDLFIDLTARLVTENGQLRGNRRRANPNVNQFLVREPEE